MPYSAMKLKLSCLGLLGLLVRAAAPHAEAAITCDSVYANLTPCLGYISGGRLGSGCCPGIRSAVGSAGTMSDRRSLCGCLKNLAASYSSRIGRANSVLKICGVRLSFPLSPSVDCSRVN